jgi:hypothetical protein
MMPALLLEFFERDPFFVYTFLAAVFLALVALLTGWLRLDFLAVFRPRGLFCVTLAVILAMALSLLSQTSLAPFTVSAATGDSSLTLSVLRGLSRLPLYVIALAYGPTAGLVSAGLFAAFATTSGTLSWAEAVLALELVVLGWFAIAPSPFRLQWAGPMNVGLAYFLTWATGGSALLQHTTGQAMELNTHWTYHQHWLLGVGLSIVLLFFLRPNLYQKFFPDSRISPPRQRLQLEVRQTVQLKEEILENERRRKRTKLTEFPVDLITQLKRQRDKD